MNQSLTKTDTMPAEEEGFSINRLLQWFFVAFLIYLLISAVGMIGSGFKGATKGDATELFAFATNPFMGLVVGILATSLVQSSSTVTSIIVGLVAGPGFLDRVLLTKYLESLGPSDAEAIANKVRTLLCYETYFY